MLHQAPKLGFPSGWHRQVRPNQSARQHLTGGTDSQGGAAMLLRSDGA